MELLGLERICPVCKKGFRYCESCWRGHKYCSPHCSLTARKHNRRESEKRYASTMKGQESRRRRQKNFRIRRILNLSVTDQSSIADHSKIKEPACIENDASRRCCRCHKAIQVIAIGGASALVWETEYFSFTRFRKRPHKVRPQS